MYHTIIVSMCVMYKIFNYTAVYMLCDITGWKKKLYSCNCELFVNCQFGISYTKFSVIFFLLIVIIMIIMSISLPLILFFCKLNCFVLFCCKIITKWVVKIKWLILDLAFCFKCCVLCCICLYFFSRYLTTWFSN